jgi:hypothetical protein
LSKRTASSTLTAVIVAITEKYRTSQFTQAPKVATYLKTCELQVQKEDPNMKTFDTLSLVQNIMTGQMLVLLGGLAEASCDGDNDCNKCITLSDW